MPPVRHTAITPLTVLPAMSGATIRRSRSAWSVPGIWIARGSAPVSLMNSARPVCNEAADDAFAHLDDRGLDGLRNISDRDDRTVSLRIRVGQEDRAAVRVEQILGMARDAVHHGGEIECRRDVAPDFGERRGLARAALRLVEQARVLQRHAHRIGERLQQAHVGGAERVLAMHVDQVDQPARLVARDQRHVDGRLLHLASRA